MRHQAWFWCYIHQIIKMRLATIIRRVLPATPLRAGIPPTWDRPDPPSTVRTPYTRRLNMQDKHFTFFDASSPLYMLVNSEVAEGDPLQAFPPFLRRLSLLFLAGFLLGAAGLLWTSRQKVQTIQNYLGQKERLQTEKKQRDEKYGLKDIINNPWNLNSFPDTFPLGNYGVFEPSDAYIQKTKAVDAIRKVNKEALNYLNTLIESSKKQLQSGSSHH